MSDQDASTDEQGSAAHQDESGSGMLERREFLRKCGKFAVLVPPTMTLLLTRSQSAEAHRPGNFDFDIGSNNNFPFTYFNPGGFRPVGPPPGGP